MSCDCKEPSKEEKIKSALKYLEWLKEELSNAKGYWYQLRMKQEIKRTKEWIKEQEQ